MLECNLMLDLCYSSLLWLVGMIIYEVYHNLLGIESQYRTLTNEMHKAVQFAHKHVICMLGCFDSSNFL